VLTLVKEVQSLENVFRELTEEAPLPDPSPKERGHGPT
jgi:hypothetical protein